MASAAPPSSSRMPCTLSCSKEPIFVGRPRTNFVLPRHPLPRFSIVALARRRRSSPASITSKNKKKQGLARKDEEVDDDIDEDAFEALFRQLEEDLKNDNVPLNDDDDDISEEDLAQLERELEEALKDDELLGLFNPASDGNVETAAEEVEEAAAADDDEEIEDDFDNDEDDEEERPIKLKNWQLKRLAYALKTGRRKTNIKNLAADLCLDRAVVLELLRDPPPNLLMMSATLPDKPESTVLQPVVRELPIEITPIETTTDAVQPEPEKNVPVHVMQSNWAARKRLKKVQLETLEGVYRKTKRPTNAMISSIVHVTNLPRRKVVKWFEDRRTEDGVPEHRSRYQRSSPETLYTS